MSNRAEKCEKISLNNRPVNMVRIKKEVKTKERKKNFFNKKKEEKKKKKS